MHDASYARSKHRLSAIIACILLLAGLSACDRRGKDSAAAENPGSAPPEDSLAARSAVPVIVQHLQPSGFQVTVDVSGSTEAIREVDISAELAGTVQRFPHRLGDALAAGELILQVDPRPYRAGVDQAKAGLLAAEAALKQAARELERATLLKEKERISDAEYEGIELGQLQAESGYHSAQAALEMAEVQLERAEIRAPFAGLLAFKGAEVGEQIAPGMPVTSVVDLSSILIRGSVSERDAVRIRNGMPVDVGIPALDEAHFAGRVRAVGVRSNPLTRAFDIEIEVPNPEGRILSGMAARAAIIVDSREGVLAIPATAVVEQYGQPVVFVAIENLAERRPVKLGGRSGDRYLVEEGLAFGERLIVKGQWSVRDSMVVEIKE